MAASTNQPTQSNVRGLHYTYVKSHGAWVFVWCADDGELDRNARIAYAIVSSPSEFSPQSGQFILTQATEGTYTFVYGVPYAIYSVSGSVKVLFTDLTPALGNPRQALGETSPDATNAGKTPSKTGWCLEGQWCKDNLNNGPLLWNLKDNNLHNNSLPVIEITDIADVSASNNGIGAPCAAMAVQYSRDTTGRIVTDANGIPQIAQYQGSNATTAQAYKIGYLALTFIPNYFGNGLHGWVGAPPKNPGPFDFTSIDSSGNLTIFPGAVNNLLIDDPFSTISCSGQNLSYITLSCQCSNNQVNSVSYKVVDTPPSPSTATLGAPPGSFSILLGLVNNADGAGVYTLYKTFSPGNIVATPSAWIQTNKTTQIQPNELPYDQWYAWVFTSTLTITTS
jgi:hypothetical protein